MTDYSPFQKCLISLTFVGNVLIIILGSAWIGLHWETIFLNFWNRKTPLMDKRNVSGDAIGLTKDSVCMSCDYLGDTVLAHETLYSDVITTECENKLCCLKDGEIRNFLQSINDLKESNSLTKTSLGWWRNRPNSAHFYMDKDTPVKDKDLQWMLADSQETAFAQGIELLNKTYMKVNSVGLYYIYAATTFDLGSRELISPFYQILRKSHPKQTNTGDESLVFHKISGLTLEKQQTIFMSGIFFLMKNHQISSELSEGGHKFLDTSAVLKSYIGAYKLHP